MTELSRVCSLEKSKFEEMQDKQLATNRASTEELSLKSQKRTIPGMARDMRRFVNMVNSMIFFKLAGSLRSFLDSFHSRYTENILFY